MADRHDTMMNPRVEGLLELTGSKFQLVTLGSRRARQINDYFNELGQVTTKTIPPQVTSVARKPLSIAFEEIAVEKIVGTEVADEELPEVISDLSEEEE